GKVSGLVETKNILQGIKGIDFVLFSEKDVVRHQLVRDIIKAYDHLEQKKTQQSSS
ncbi:MAG: PhoH family protein, partial [Desulfobacterales bacterium]|nr:PhoH family protein [Desulfobacterales bacterium]